MTVDRDELERLLLQHRDQVRGQVARLQADLDQLTRARRSESDDDEHDPEGETLSAQWSMRAGLLESARADEQAVDAAIQRLHEGTYGTCATCHRPIPLEQLEVRPFRTSCVACSR